MDNKFLSRIKEKFARLKHKELLIALSAIAVMLVIYFSSAFGGSSVAEDKGRTSSDYCSRMETEVKNAVVGLSGDKNAQVAVNWASGVESVIAYTTTENQSSVSSAPTIVSGSGPVVLGEIYPKALGVAVVVKGGDAVKLRLDIVNLISTLLDVSPEKIAVYAKK